MPGHRNPIEDRMPLGLQARLLEEIRRLIRTEVQSTIYGDIPELPHHHALSDVTGLQELLAGTAPLQHGHAQSDVIGLGTALSSKAEATHQHAVTDIPGLQESLDAALTPTLPEHTHQSVKIVDVRGVDSPPSYYWLTLPGTATLELKQLSTLGVPSPVGTYGTLRTFTPWNDASGGTLLQEVFDDTILWKRASVDEQTWGAWFTDTPPGLVTPYAGVTAPPGWLLCDGSAVSRSTYARLFAAIGTSYGAGNGVTTFNTPDLKGRVPTGLDAGQTEFQTCGKSGGAKTHSLSAAEMPAHSHKLRLSDAEASGYGLVTGAVGFANRVLISGTPGTTSSDTAGSSAPHNNLSPYLVLNYLIKS